MCEYEETLLRLKDNKIKGEKGQTKRGREIERDWEGK